MNTAQVVALAFGIGVVAGLRSMLAPAAIVWGARLGWLNLTGSVLSFMGSTVALLVFSFAALAELIADKCPGVPRRTGLMPLLARIITGGLSGACLSISAHHSAMIGLIAGAIGSVIGAFAGYETRQRLVRQIGLRDLFVAIPEDLIATGLALLVVAR